ncbi:MAG: NAD(P)/FAD-dependent oxidoreductase [Candidatus Korobacteraceae bacterium]
MSNPTFDVIVLGGGAAGLMCAFEAGKRGRRVAVLEHADRIGKKILISGGGRCNFTNLHCRPENFLSENPHFCKSALARYTPADFIGLVEKHEIPYHEKKLGQLFCDRSAQEIVEMLEAECRAAGVQIFVKTRPLEVQRRSGKGFVVRTEAGELQADALVVATGGLSIPKIGATSFGYEIARQFGINIRECRPALVPFVFNAQDRQNYCDLAGVATEVTVSVGRRQFSEKLLITHRGLSGPAILQISSYWKPSEAIEIDLAPGQRITDALRQDGARRDLATAKSALHAALPIRFAERWLELHPPQRWTNSALDEMERQIHTWEVLPDGTEGYEKAEVTAGGIDTDELSARTMESRKVPGLVFIGEVVDVTGHLGGHNFQWAWASGFCAGQAV